MIRVSRRTFTRGLGAAVVAAPFMELLLSGRRARAANAAKRIIFWFTPNGTVHRHWRPTGDGANYSFAAGSILEPLSAHRDQLLVLDGLNFVGMRGGSHEGGMEHMLTGGGAPSVDQYIASQLAAPTAFPSIELSVQTTAWGAGVQTRMAYDAAHNYVHPEDNPGAAYRRLFGGVSTEPGVVDPMQAGRRSVLDLVKGELSQLQHELGNEERVKLEAHLDALRRMEQRVSGTAPTTAGCTALIAPNVASPQDNNSFPDVGAAQMEMLVAAARCDLSRVLSLQWSHTVSPAIPAWAGANEGHHELSHKDDSNTAGVASFVASERWFASQFAAFLDQLEGAQEPDGSGSLLDTSLVVWTKELADGRLHNHDSVPFVIAGGGNGTVNPGRYLKLGGVPHQHLLVSLCHAMGLTNNTFGVAAVMGPLSGLSS